MHHRILVLVAISGLFSPASAAVVEFVVDPSLTRWSMRGAYFPDGQQQGDLAGQFPGSETTSLTGILRVDLTPTTIQFLPGSALSAEPQALPQQPGVNGAPGVASADFGMHSPTLVPPIPFFAARDVGFTLSSPPIALVGDHFTEDLEAIVNARIDYDLGTAAGSYVLTDWSRGFDDDHVGSITTSGSIQTLRLQNYLGDIFALQRPSDSYMEWAGPIIATRVIPEPGGVLLAASALGGWAVLAFGRAPRRLFNAAEACSREAHAT
jgi:hypothetical protein